MAQTLSSLSLTLEHLGDLPEAERTGRDALGMRRKLLGNDHPAVASSLIMLAVMLREQGDFAEAAAMDQEAIGIYRKRNEVVPGPVKDLGKVRSFQGDAAGGAALLQEALAMSRDSQDNLEIAYALDGLASIACAQGNPAEAERPLATAWMGSVARSGIG